MFGKTLQKIEMQSLKFFLGHICETSLMNSKIAFCFDKIFIKLNMALTPFIGLAQPAWLGSLAETKTNTSNPACARIQVQTKHSLAHITHIKPK